MLPYPFVFIGVCIDALLPLIKKSRIRHHFLQKILVPFSGKNRGSNNNYIRKLNYVFYRPKYSISFLN